jgi:uncharacterized membrane protein YccC
VTAPPPFLRRLTRLDRSRVSLARGVRAAAAVVGPIAIGALTGYLLPGLIIGLGALNVSFPDQPDPYRAKARRMLVLSALGAVSASIGAATSRVEWLAVALAAVWGFGGARSWRSGREALRLA